MFYNHLFSSYDLGGITLQNRIIMSPMTRSRSIGNVASSIMSTYYSQRASAGLIITEGIAPSPNGLGYARTPGIYSEAQIKSWKPIIAAVHRNGGRIFAQLMHVGRISHALNMPAGAEIIAPSPIRANGKMWTDEKGMLDLPVPKEMTADDIKITQKEFVEAAKNAIEAGFDGVELHGANGYLLEQFLSPFSNERTDDYGGSIEKRARFVLETVAAVAAAIGYERVGLRISPYSPYNDMQAYPEIDQTYIHLAEKLDQMGIAYLHLLDNIEPGFPQSLKRSIGKKFSQTIILAGNYSKEKAEKDIESGLGNLVAFGRPFINNPDLVTRFRNNWQLSENLDPSTFFSAGEQGYIDYPVYQDNAIAV